MNRTFGRPEQSAFDLSMANEQAMMNSNSNAQCPHEESQDMNMSEHLAIEQQSVARTESAAPRPKVELPLICKVLRNQTFNIKEDLTTQSDSCKNVQVSERIDDATSCNQSEQT